VKVCASKSVFVPLKYDEILYRPRNNWITIIFNKQLTNYQKSIFDVFLDSYFHNNDILMVILFSNEILWVGGVGDNEKNEEVYMKVCQLRLVFRFCRKIIISLETYVE
jgi:hypothetical protein